MKKKREKKYDSLRRREALTGLAFISPWLIGFIFIFGRMFISSLIYAFNIVNITPDGITKSFNGLNNFFFPFTSDVQFFNKYFKPDVLNFAYEVPIIVIFSLFAAVLLNQKFFGRTFTRAIFFLPVIIMSGVVVTMLKSNGFSYDTDMVSSENAYIFNSGGVITILRDAGLPISIVKWFAEVSNRIYDIVWKSGIQIVLFLAGLQGIPRSEYEAAEVEGATAWECFWKITFPRISPITLVVVVYSIIDSFGNAMGQVRQFFLKNGNLGISSALAVLYSSIIIIVLLIVSGIISRFVFYLND